MNFSYTVVHICCHVHCVYLTVCLNQVISQKTGPLALSYLCIKKAACIVLTISVVSPYWALSVNFLLAYWTIDSYRHIEEYGVYVEAQGGFREGRGTTNSIFVLTSLIQHFLNHGKSLYLAFIDFSKAFDYVVRENLWFKLVNAGMSWKILEIIKSMYYVVKTQIFFSGREIRTFYEPLRSAPGWLLVAIPLLQCT